MPNEFQNLKIRTGRDPAQNVVAAALQFEFLQSGALLRDAQQPHFAGADDVEAAQVRAPGGEGGEAVVDDFDGEHVFLAEAPIGGEVGMEVHGEEAVAEKNGGIARENEGGGEQIDVVEVGEAVDESTGEEEVPVGDCEGADETALEIEPALADQSIGVSLSRGVGEECEDFEENLVGEEKSSVGDGGERRESGVVFGGEARRERVKLHCHDHLVYGFGFGP